MKFKVLGNMMTAIDNVLECVTAEIYKEKLKNRIISCIYRVLGSSIETL